MTSLSGVAVTLREIVNFRIFYFLLAMYVVFIELSVIL